MRRWAGLREPNGGGNTRLKPREKAAYPRLKEAGAEKPSRELINHSEPYRAVPGIAERILVEFRKKTHPQNPPGIPLTASPAGGRPKPSRLFSRLSALAPPLFPACPARYLRAREGEERPFCPRSGCVFAREMLLLPKAQASRGGLALGPWNLHPRVPHGPSPVWSSGRGLGAP